MKNKINYDTMKETYDGLLKTFVAKNKDYGSSFERSMDTYGEVASLVRMEDKFNRLKSLIDGDKRAEVASESLSDTLLDLANYAVMTAVYLKGKNGNKKDDVSSTFLKSRKSDGPELTLVPRLSDGHMYGPYVIFGGKVNLLYYPGTVIKIDKHDDNPMTYNFILQRDSFNGVDTLFLFDYLYQTVDVLNEFTKGYLGDLFDFTKKHNIKNVKSLKKEKATEDIFKQIDLHQTLSSEFVRPEDEADVYTVGPTSIRCINRIKMNSDWDKNSVIIHGTLAVDKHNVSYKNFIFFEDTGKVVMAEENLMPTFDNGNNINGIIKSKCDFSGSYSKQVKRFFKDDKLLENMQTVIKLNEGHSVVKENPVTLASKKYVFEKSITFRNERVTLYVLPHTVINKRNIVKDKRLYPVVVWDDTLSIHIVLYLNSMSDIADFINMFNKETYNSIQYMYLRGTISSKDKYKEIGFLNEHKVAIPVYMEEVTDWKIVRYFIEYRDFNRDYTITSVKHEPTTDVLYIHGFIKSDKLHGSQEVRRFTVLTNDYNFEEY